MREHPDLNQLKRQAKELLEAFRASDPAAAAEVAAHFDGADNATFALHDAQLVLARAYGFESWPRLKEFVEGIRVAGRIIKPAALETESGRDTWDTIAAAAAGDVAALRRLLERDPHLARAGYWYAPAVHFAAREGHVEAVRLLLDSGADPERNGLNDRNMIEMSREHGHEQIAQLLEQERARRGRIMAQSADHPIHKASALGELDTIRALLNADPSLLHLGSRRGLTPLHCAAIGGSRAAVNFLLDRGANIHARNPADLEPIDFTITGEHPTVREEVARLLILRGATYDLTIAAALGDFAAVRQMLNENPARIREARPHGRRPLSAAIELGHDDVARLLLERGANPRWDEPDAPHGTSVHAASRMGNISMLKLLLEHGADPNEEIDSASSPMVFAASSEIRAVLEAYGGEPLQNDEDFVKMIAADPGNSERVGFTFAMNADRPEMLSRLLAAGLRMPAVHTSCQGYLLNPNALRILLAHGMSPDQMNWQHQTLLHHASTRDSTECAAILMDAGARITARDDEYRSTPLAWAARVNKPVMVEFLLSRGAPVQLPDDEPWATPLAWAERRGHQQIASILRSHGAER
jgi:ankyrin repeat protein